MGQAMGDPEVFRILLDDGYICQKIPVLRRREYGVFTADPGSPSGHRHVGHITERQFGAYCAAGIIALERDPLNLDKAGTIRHVYILSGKTDESK